MYLIYIPVDLKETEAQQKRLVLRIVQDLYRDSFLEKENKSNKQFARAIGGVSILWSATKLLVAWWNPIATSSGLHPNYAQKKYDDKHSNWGVMHPRSY